MDGFAIQSHDVAAGVKRLEVIETIIAGGWPEKPIQSGQATRIMTGAPLPENADAVVMIEQAETESVDDSEWVRLNIDSISPEKNILRQGVNFTKGQSVFPKGHVVRPTDIGLLAEVGANSVLTGGKPTVAVLPTGNELVDCSQTPGRGQIRNSNGPMLIAMARGLGLEVTDLGIGRDDAQQLRDLIQQGLKHDLLLLSGGVSAGTMDLVPAILQDLGVKQIFHKVSVKPGKPIWFGILESSGKKTYVFGLPGNPVSSLVGFHLFVRASIRKMMGGATKSFHSVMGKLTVQHETRGNRPTYWPGRLVDSETSARPIEPLIWRGSSDLLALGQADGLIHFSADSHLHPAGEEVRFFPLDK
jgi:molybdopterin molybdotransferase